jgi:GNAT superfamily N-acetyltransferase
LQNISRSYISEDYLDRINAFDCSDKPVVEYFLKDEEEALLFHKHNYVNTTLYFLGEELVGYYSLQASKLKINGSLIYNNDWQENLPIRAEYPIIDIVYLGVDKRYRRKGIGRIMMRDIFDITYKFAEEIGCNFLYVEALPGEDSTGLYTNLGFVEIDTDESRDTKKMVFKI